LPRIELPDLVDGGLRLRAPTGRDIATVTAACQDPDIQRWTRVPSPYREQDARFFVEEVSAGCLEKGSGVHLLVVPTGPAGEPGGELFGAVGFSIDRADFSGEFGYWLVPAARGRGVATRAGRLLCRFAFEGIGLGYLGLIAAADNSASNAVARRLGFTHEGTLRDAMIDGPSGDPSAPRCDANWWGLRPGELTGA
jgi:RimJ/RimL family protein N-acetyltransferase